MVVILNEVLKLLLSSPVCKNKLQKCWDSLYKKLGNHRPSTGAMIINLFCEHLTVTQLSIVGFDFKKSKTYYLGNDHKGPHHWENEEIYATNLVSEAVNNQLNWSIK